MHSRIDLSNILKNAIGSNNVYFQPPESINLVYPCIIYRLSDIDTKFADDVPYLNQKRYQVMVVDKNPDSQIPDLIAKLPKCSFDRHYTADNLNHYVYNLYF